MKLEMLNGGQRAIGTREKIRRENVDSDHSAHEQKLHRNQWHETMLRRFTYTHSRSYSHFVDEIYQIKS